MHQVRDSFVAHFSCVKVAEHSLHAGLILYQMDHKGEISSQNNSVSHL